MSAMVFHLEFLSALVLILGKWVHERDGKTEDLDGKCPIVSLEQEELTKASQLNRL